MAQITGETVRRMARDIFDYEIAEADAEAMAHTAGAMLTMLRAGAPLPASCFDDAAQQNQITQAAGYYRLDINFLARTVLLERVA